MNLLNGYTYTHKDICILKKTNVTTGIYLLSFSLEQVDSNLGMIGSENESQDLKAD